MMAGPPIDPGAAPYVRMMSVRRRGLARHWPLVLVALGVAIAIGVESPDRSKPEPAARPAAVVTVK